MTYDQRIEQLFSLHRSVQSSGFSADAYKPGLQGMMRLDEALGHPHRRFPSVHVAGTNGKGSVCSMIAAALAAEGLRVGLYTSPHLLDFRERIKIVSSGGFEMIPREDVMRFLDEYEEASGGLTFFEITTGMAFWWFAQQGVDYAVIETGLGGRLDSTNIITPRLCVITSIGLDHCELLGPDRRSIAFEKAGIFKQGVPALVWGRDPETSPVFEQRSGDVGCPLHYADDYPVSATSAEEAHTAINYRTAAVAARLLGLNPAPGVLENAAKSTGLRARWEIIQSNPLTICDIGHNPPAIRYNMQRLQELRGEPRRPLLIVYGAMADKDVDSIAGLLPADARYFLAAPATPRAMAAPALALKLKHFRCNVAQSVAAAVSAAMTEAQDLDNPVIYIGGSTYVACEAISYLESL